MSTFRPFALVDGGDAWARASFQNATLEFQAGVIQLGWTDPPPDARVPLPTGYLPAFGGAAFDAECRLYRADRAHGQVTRTLWRLPGPLTQADAAAEPLALFDAEPAPAWGDFAAVRAAAGPLHDPLALAVDVDDRLFIAEGGTGRVLVFDLWSRRLLRAVTMPGGTRPLDLAVDGRTVYVALDGAPGLVTLTARNDPRPVDLPPEVLLPSRVAASPGGRIAVLVGARTPAAVAVPLDDVHAAVGVPNATDLEWESDDVLAVGFRPGEAIERWRVTGAVERILPLTARGADGSGLVRTPDGRIGYGTADGVKTAPVARVRYAQRGTVLTWQLDAGEYQAQWGRIFLDACIPLGCGLRVWCATADETFDEPQVARGAPDNVAVDLRYPELSPSLPPVSMVPADADGILPGSADWRPVHRRETGRELAWVEPPADDAFVTYEAPVPAGPGRFLWIGLELTGNSRATPRVRTLRAETRSHDLLRRLPRTFSRDEVSADFLRRFLAICDGVVDELDARAALRNVLLDPRGTPEDMLPWLAGFLGLALDQRFPVDRRRALVAEAAWLFRFRGTVQGLTRFLEIYLGDDTVVLLEAFRLRGMGGAVLGDRGAASSTSVVGGGFRVGGQVGEPGEAPLQGSLDDAFRLHAHRFTVLVRGSLDAEQLAVVNDILELHRPAHTRVEICTVGAGMRVGRGLHVGISSNIGRTGGFRALQLGAAALGRGAIVGRPETAIVPGSARLGRDSRVG